MGNFTNFLKTKLGQKPGMLTARVGTETGHVSSLGWDRNRAAQDGKENRAIQDIAYIHTCIHTYIHTLFAKTFSKKSKHTA